MQAGTQKAALEQQAMQLAMEYEQRKAGSGVHCPCCTTPLPEAHSRHGRLPCPFSGWKPALCVSIMTSGFLPLYSCCCRGHARAHTMAHTISTTDKDSVCCRTASQRAWSRDASRKLTTVAPKRTTTTTTTTTNNNNNNSSNDHDNDNTNNDKFPLLSLVR